jgi:hypothetical protein
MKNKKLKEIQKQIKKDLGFTDPFYLFVSLLLAAYLSLDLVKVDLPITYMNFLAGSFLSLNMIRISFTISLIGLSFAIFSQIQNILTTNIPLKRYRLQNPLSLLKLMNDKPKFLNDPKIHKDLALLSMHCKPFEKLLSKEHLVMFESLLEFFEKRNIFFVFDIKNINDIPREAFRLEEFKEILLWIPLSNNKEKVKDILNTFSDTLENGSKHLILDYLVKEENKDLPSDVSYVFSLKRDEKIITIYFEKYI